MPAAVLVSIGCSVASSVAPRARTAHDVLQIPNAARQAIDPRHHQHVPSRTKSRIVFESSRPLVVVLLRFSARIMSQPAAFAALTMSQLGRHDTVKKPLILALPGSRTFPMSGTERFAPTKRFSSPAALAAFGAFAAPEPIGLILLICAAVWWWRARRRSAGD